MSLFARVTNLFHRRAMPVRPEAEPTGPRCSETEEHKLTDPTLQLWLNKNCYRHGRMAISNLVKRFRATLTPNAAAHYRQRRFQTGQPFDQYVLEQLQLQFPVGMDDNGGRWVVGLSFDPEAKSDWQVDEHGRIHRVPVCPESDRTFQSWIDANCYRHGRAKVCEVVRRFRDSLDPSSAHHYRRTDILRQLQSTFAIGKDGLATWVVGLSFEPAACGCWRVDEHGRVRRIPDCKQPPKPEDRPRRAIENYSLATGETIEQFASVKAAAKHGYNETSVADVLRGFHRHHRQLGWRYSGQPATPFKKGKRIRTYGGIIEAFDPKTGQVVYTLRHITDAPQHGFQVDCIYNVLRGWNRTHGGFGWRVRQRRIEARCPTTGNLLLTFDTGNEARAQGYDQTRITEVVKSGGTYRHLHWSYSIANAPAEPACA